MITPQLSQLGEIWDQLGSSDRMMLYVFASKVLRIRKEDILDEDDPDDEARHILAEMLDIANEACGGDIIKLAYGYTPETRTGQLRAFAQRARLASLVFREEDKGSGSLREAANEALDVAAGDVPEFFAKHSARRRRVRLARAKLMALRMDAWLAGSGHSPASRHSAISSAFNAEWDTISRWSSDARDIFGPGVDRTLEKDRRLGERGRKPFHIHRARDWQAALADAADTYRALLRR